MKISPCPMWVEWTFHWRRPGSADINSEARDERSWGHGRRKQKKSISLMWRESLIDHQHQTWKSKSLLISMRRDRSRRASINDRQSHSEVLCIIYWPSPEKKKLQPSGIAFNGLSRFAKRIKHPILILCHFHGEKKSSPGCCAAAIGRYCMKNMHNSHTEIIVITVKCPLMESHRVFELVEGLARASTVRCLCSF